MKYRPHCKYTANSLAQERCPCNTCYAHIQSHHQQQIQQMMQFDRTVANAKAHLRAGNWNQTVQLLSPLLRESPADIRLHRLILQAATKEFHDYEMAESGLRAAASEAWDRLARMNGLTGEMLRYSQICYEKRMEKLTAIRNKFLVHILIASGLFLYMGANMATCSGGLYLLLAAALIWVLYRAVKMHPSGALREMRAAPPEWSANPFTR